MGQFSPQQIISRGLGLILYRKQTTRYPTQPKSPQTPYCCSKLQTPTVARLKPSPQLLFSQWPVYTSKTQLQPKKTEEKGLLCVTSFLLPARLARSGRTAPAVARRARDISFRDPCPPRSRGIAPGGRKGRDLRSSAARARPSSPPRA